MKPTLRTIANELQLSPSLVSQVLNGKPGVWASAETRQRVLDAARAVNYRPSASARALVTGRTMQIAVAMELSPGAGALGASNSNGIVEAAGERRYRVVTVPLRDRETGVRQIEELAQERVCDGVCLFSAMSDAGYLKVLEERQVPTVLIGDLPNELDAKARFAVCIDHDNYRIGYDSTAWMLGQGHQRVAWIFTYGEADQPHARELRRGYEDAVRAAGRETLYVPAPEGQEGERHPLEDTTAQLRTALAMGADAVVVRWLPAVIRWLRVFRECGEKQTGDRKAGGRKASGQKEDKDLRSLPLMALIGNNDVWFLENACLGTGVACLTWDDVALGARAANCLIDWIEKGKPLAHTITVPPGSVQWVEEGKV